MFLVELTLFSVVCPSCICFLCKCKMDVKREMEGLKEGGGEGERECAGAEVCRLRNCHVLVELTLFSVVCPSCI